MHHIEASALERRKLIEQSKSIIKDNNILHRSNRTWMHTHNLSEIRFNFSFYLLREYRILRTHRTVPFPCGSVRTRITLENTLKSGMCFFLPRYHVETRTHWWDKIHLIGIAGMICFTHIRNVLSALSPCFSYIPLLRISLCLLHRNIEMQISMKNWLKKVLRSQLKRNGVWLKCNRSKCTHSSMFIFPFSCN